MATLTIRNLPDEVRDRLRVVAAKQGRSMEAEARHILQQACVGQPAQLSNDEADAIAGNVQAALARYKPADVSVVDELIAERRQESRDETLEALRDGPFIAPDTADSTPNR